MRDLILMNKIKRIIHSIALLLLVVFILQGCGNKAESVTASVDKDDSKEEIQIGIAFDSFLIERWERDRDIFVSRARDLGAEVNVQNANGNVQKQKDQIKYLIDKKMDVIVIVAVDSSELKKEVEEAQDAGIKVVAYDRLVMDSPVDLYISFDNEMVGTLMGEALVDSELPNKKVLMLSGPNEDNNVSMVESGFRRVMEENDIEIVDCFHAYGWKAEEAASYISEHITELDDIDAIMCGNDNIATTIIRTLSEARLAGKIKIVGQDADIEACQRVVEGTQVMTVYKPVEKLAQAAAEYAIELAENKEVSNVTDTINDGTNDVPYVYLTPIAVTKDNIDETVIESGFHPRDEVYMNVLDPSEAE